ncbi:MAG: 30S ribosomal protein S16 [Planctomycetes bacterium]|nr:30S ribosomal protein S16 [Planctomycetota bacterium]
MKKMGRAHRPFYRICAFDQHTPRDGRPIEELGTYDTSVPETDARAVFDAERVDYWLSVGAQPSEKCAVLIKKYGSAGTHIQQQKEALERLSAPKTIADPGAPASLPKKAEEPKPEEPAAEVAKAEAPAAEEAKTEEAPAAEVTEAKAAPAAEKAPAEEAPKSDK